VRNAEEVVLLDELRRLLEERPRPKAYWGFECSGMMHIGMGLVTGSKIRDMVEAGFDFTIFLADWHSWINNKMGGDMERIRKVGEYFKHCFTAVGVPPDKVRYVWASELASDPRYWEIVVRVAKSSTLSRVRRALPIMGRSLTEAGDIEAAWMIYPCMQVADIFYMDLDVACGGIDQRKARADAVIASKMSKSVPERCIFIHDEPEEIRRKVRRAYCPPRQAEGNPVMEIARLIVFPLKSSLTVRRPSGGPRTYEGFSDLERDYLKGDVHPLDLKEAVAEALIEILEPVRRYFKGREKVIEEVRELEATR